MRRAAPILALAPLALAMPLAAQDTAGQPPSLASPTDLPEPDSDPLAVDFSDDPILVLSRSAVDPADFRQIVSAAVQQNAIRREAEARVDLAQAELDEAEAGRLPTMDVTVTSYKTLVRDFGDDPFNLIERSRPSERTDATAGLEYVLFDWGAVNGATIAAQARLRAAGFDRDAALTQVISDLVIAWYSVFAYQSLHRLADAYVAAQDDIAAAVERRIAQGVSAPSERSRVASLRAEGEIRRAQFARQQASAEARFRELTGIEAPPLLQRPPLLDQGQLSREYVIAAAGQTPEVQSAEARARAARVDVRTARASQAPRVGARVDAGRYGVLEGTGDYDVRGTLYMRYRLFGGGGNARIDQARAQAEGALATADRVREESEREAAVAWADVRALEVQLVALEASYKAARQTRDAVFRRFSALRGSLFDASEAQSAYLEAAIAYIQGLTQLDAAHYTLLARTGRSLELFGEGITEE